MSDNTKKSILSETRMELAKSGQSDVGIKQELQGLDEIWNEMQTVRQEMNDAKRTAAEKAAEPFLERLKELEEQYALALKMSS